METLTIEEIYCLAGYGMTTPQIIKTDLTKFESLYDDNSYDFDKWLDYSEKVFDRQEALGIRYYIMSGRRVSVIFVVNRL